MIDIETERLIRLEDVRDFLPSSRKGKRLSKSVPFRWAARGVKGVILETLRVGGARYTSVQAVQRFVEALNAPTSLPAKNERTPTPNKRDVERELAKRGL